MAEELGGGGSIRVLLTKASTFSRAFELASGADFLFETCEWLELLVNQIVKIPTTTRNQTHCAAQNTPF